jgi:MFS family permease
MLLSAAVFLGYANQWMVTPVISLYVHSQGGSAFVAGLALLAFAVPSVTVRPYIGRLTDHWNAAGVLALGLIAMALGSAILLLPAFYMLFAGSIVRGLGWAGVNTGGYARLAADAPPERRGEAAGYYTAATSAASMLFPALGLWLLQRDAGFPLVFFVSIVLALAGLPIALLLARDGRAPAVARSKDGNSGPVLERGVLIATALNLSSTLAMPAVMAFLPLFAKSLGIANVGAFYFVAGVVNILLRPALGRWSDGMGRAPGIALGLGAQFVGILLIATADGLVAILIGGLFVALGMSLTTSMTTALAMDLAKPEARGRAMATYSMSYQIGAGLGALVSGALADLVGLRGMYVGSLVITASGLALLAATRHRLPGSAKSQA